MPRVVQIVSDHFSNRRENRKLPAPANVTCHAVALIGSTLGHFFDNTEPSAQLKDPARSANDHHNSRLPTLPGVMSLGQIRTTTPAIPSNSPPLPRPEM